MIKNRMFTTILLIVWLMSILVGPVRAQEGDYTITDLGTLDGSFSSASAINELGQVVGESFTASGQLHASFWER